MSNKETKIQVRTPEKVEKIEEVRTHRVYTPPVDIVETNNEYLLWFDMPGVEKKSIEVTLEKNVLTVKGHVPPVFPEGFKLNYMEFEIGDYERSFTLTNTIDQNGIEANYKNGVLELRLPKVEEARPRTITVKTA